MPCHGPLCRVVIVWSHVVLQHGPASMSSLCSPMLCHSIVLYCAAVGCYLSRHHHAVPCHAIAGCCSLCCHHTVPCRATVGCCSLCCRQAVPCYAVVRSCIMPQWAAA